MFNATVISNALHVRQAPGRSNDSITLITQGTSVTVLGLDPSGTWLNVKYGNGNKTGWCAAKYLMPDHDVTAAPWLDQALAEIGVCEMAGEQAHPRILQYLASVDDLSSLDRQSDETPWCSCFINWLVKQPGLYGTNSAAARSWRNWRTARSGIGKAVIGDIAVFTRQSATESGGHVAIYITHEGTGPQQRVLVLGGNQSNAVRYSWYPTQGDVHGTHYELVSLRTL